MRPSLIWLSISVFLLLGVPRMGVKVGPIPIYVIDICVAVTFLLALQLPKVGKKQNNFTVIVVAILFFILISELATALLYGSPLQPMYQLARNLLAASLFYSAGRIIQSGDDLLLVAKAGLAGVLITATLMIMSSLPVTRGLATSYVFSIPFLEPASARAVQKFSLIENATRGRSLVGVSILSGAFLNTFWPLVGLLYKWQGSIGGWRMVALLGTLLAPFGVIMSYSRGAILGLAMVVGSVIVFGSGKSRQGIVLAVLFGVTLVSVVGWQSDYFYFERLEKRTAAMLDNPYKDARETERLYAYSEPFSHILENPQFFVLGEGTSVDKIAGVASEAAGMANHAVFAQAYYSYGLIAAFLYAFLVIKGFLFLWREINLRSGEQSVAPFYAQALFAGLAGMLPWFLFGHAAVSTPRGAMLFFLLFGMIASLSNFPYEKDRRPVAV